MLWICCNIAVSSPNAAISVYKNEIFEYWLESLWEGNIDNIGILKEAIYLVTHVFSTLPDPFKFEILEKAVIQDENWGRIDLYKALVGALEVNFSTDITKNVLKTIKDIFEISERYESTQHEGNSHAAMGDSHITDNNQVQNSLLQKQEFVDAGGPEILEVLLDDANHETQKLAADISRRYFNEEIDQIYDLPANTAEEEMKF